MYEVPGSRLRELTDAIVEWKERAETAERQLHEARTQVERLERERDEAEEQAKTASWRHLDEARERSAAETQLERCQEAQGNVSAFTFFPNDDPREVNDHIRVERSYWQGRSGPFPHPKGEWAIRWLSYCLNRDGEWEYEPQPSSRDDAFFTRCRFHLDEALKIARSRSQQSVPNTPETE